MHYFCDLPLPVGAQALLTLGPSSTLHHDFWAPSTELLHHISQGRAKHFIITASGKCQGQGERKRVRGVFFPFIIVTVINVQVLTFQIPLCSTLVRLWSSTLSGVPGPVLVPRPSLTASPCSPRCFHFPAAEGLLGASKQEK